MKRDISKVVFDCLHEMDGEARGRFGLEDYGRFARPELRRPSAEKEWARRLSTLLTRQGFISEQEVSYPNQKKRKCDLRVIDNNGARLWIEMKGAWKSWWLGQGSERIYRSYLFHPLIRGLLDKAHTAALDISKLENLTRTNADEIGFLLIGFDDEREPMSPDIEQFQKLSGLDFWNQTSREWGDFRRQDAHVRCWFWWRAVSKEQEKC